MLHVDSPSSSNTNLVIVSTAQPAQSTEDSQINALSAVSIDILPSLVLLATARNYRKLGVGNANKPSESCLTKDQRFHSLPRILHKFYDYGAFVR